MNGITVPKFLSLFFVSLSAGTAGAAVPAELGQYAETPILRFHSDKDPLKVGQAQTIFIQGNVGFTKDELAIEVLLDGAPQGLVQSTPTLWILSLAPFTEIRAHLLEARVYVRNAQESGRIRDAMAATDAAIATLNGKIGQESDAQKKVTLIAIRDSKQAYRDQLDVELANLRVYFKTESLAFEVKEDPANAAFPRILSISPNVGPEAGGTVIQILGTNFPSGARVLPAVKIGGISAAVASANATSISVVTPVFSSSGAKDIEVSWASATEPKNAFFPAGFFAAANTQVSQNTKPVAVATGYQFAAWPHPAPITLSGAQSYDENGDSLGFTWTTKVVPKNSALVPGAVLCQAASCNFAPDRRGNFVFELKVRETNTSQSLQSFPILVTVEVN